jgi:hypothetical protein
MMTMINARSFQMKLTRYQTWGLVALLSASASVFAQEKDCSNYPKPGATKQEITPKGIKLVITVQESVPFDDSDVQQHARDVAETKAKSKIADFIQNDITKEKNIQEAAMLTSSVTGENSKKASFDKAQKTAQAYKDNASAILRGVTVLDECYTPGKFLRLTVGIKPETIEAAGVMAGQLSKSLNDNPTARPESSKPAGKSAAGDAKGKNGKADPPQEMPLNKIEGYGGSGNIDKF